MAKKPSQGQRGQRQRRGGQSGGQSEGQQRGRDEE